MRILFLVTFFMLSITSKGQNYTTRYFDFSVNYWFNMHHFLYQKAFFNSHSDVSIVDLELPEEDNNKLGIAVDFYKENLINEDLRMSDYMTDFKNWITGVKEPMSQIPLEFIRHATVLKGFDEAFKKHFWSKHKDAIDNVLDENIDLIRRTEYDYVDSMQQITRQIWQQDTIKVDVVYYGKVSARNYRNRPYTSIFPTHVVMNVASDNDISGGWLELLYHEAAHHLILSEAYFVGGTIWDVANEMKVSIPRQLWHMYLFYFSGEITRGLLEDVGINYPQTYIQRNGIYRNYFTLLDQYILPYMKRETSLAAATQKMIEDIYKD